MVNVRLITVYSQTETPIVGQVIQARARGFKTSKELVYGVCYELVAGSLLKNDLFLVRMPCPRGVASRTRLNSIENRGGRDLLLIHDLSSIAVQKALLMLWLRDGIRLGYGIYRVDITNYIECDDQTLG